MTAKEINKKIQEMISSDSVPQDEIIRFVKGECQTVALTPQTLGMLFEMYADVKYDVHDPTSCFSREIPISEVNYSAIQLPSSSHFFNLRAIIQPPQLQHWELLRIFRQGIPYGCSQLFSLRNH